MQSNQQQLKTGYILGISAYVMWGVFPLYFKLLNSIPAAEIVAHRVLWSALFSLLLLVIWKHPHWLQNVIQNPKNILWLLCSSSLVCSNWVLYIWAVNNGHVLDASLGYYINPLVNVLLALCFLGEKLRRLQWIAVILATIGVLQQVVALGKLPWIALYLAFSFGSYGFLRKKIAIAALPGLAIETILICPIALIWLMLNPNITSGNIEFWQTMSALWLIITGPVTIIPLIFFNMAAKVLPFTTIGFLQYLAPTLLLLQAVFLFNEPLTSSTLISFIFIWSALIVYSLDIYLRFNKRART